MPFFIILFPVLVLYIFSRWKGKRIVMKNPTWQNTKILLSVLKMMARKYRYVIAAAYVIFSSRTTAITALPLRFFTSTLAHNFFSSCAQNLPFLFDNVVCTTTYFFSWAFLIPPIYPADLRNNTLYIFCIRLYLPVCARVELLRRGLEKHEGKGMDRNKGEKKLRADRSSRGIL